MSILSFSCYQVSTNDPYFNHSARLSLSLTLSVVVSKTKKTFDNETVIMISSTISETTTILPRRIEVICIVLIAKFFFLIIISNARKCKNIDNIRAVSILT